MIKIEKKLYCLQVGRETVKYYMGGATYYGETARKGAGSAVVGSALPWLSSSTAGR